MSRAAAPWWRGRVAPAGLLLSLTLGSCGRANDDAVGDGAAGAGGVLAAPLPSFDEVRQRWSADGQEGIFSLAWQEYPEEVLFVHAGAYFGRGEESCAVYEEDSYLEGSSRYSSWFMQLYLSEAKPGVYAVRPQDTVGAPPTVQVLVYRFERGELRELHTAISGELEVSEVPASTADWHSGVGFRLRGRLEFSSHEDDQSEGCEVTSTIDGTQTVTCRCLPTTGDPYDCTKESVDDPSCCIDLVAPRLPLEVDLIGSQCKALCDVVGGVSNRWCEREL